MSFNQHGNLQLSLVKLSHIFWYAPQNAGHIFIDFSSNKWTMKHKILGNNLQINLEQMCDRLIKLY